MTIENRLEQEVYNLKLLQGRIIGLGIDILEPNRVGKDIEDNPLFAEEFCTKEEIVFCDQVSGKERMLRYARKFALKEATIKALGGGGEAGEEPELDWREIVNVENDIELRGRARQRADEQRITSLTAFYTSIKNTPIVICIATNNPLA